MTVNIDEFDTVYDFDIPDRPLAIVTHKPTGMIASCNETSSELINRSKAIATIARKLDGEAPLNCACTECSGYTTVTMRTQRRR